MERLKELRKLLKMTQQQFGERLKLRHNTIGQYESGTRKMSETIKKLICKEYYVNFDWLEHGKGDIFNEKLIISNLSERELNLIERFKKLNDEQQAYILSLIDKHIKN